MTNTMQRTSIADAIGTLIQGESPVRLTAYDGSSLGPVDAELSIELLNERGLSYVLTAPGDLGLARAYASGDLALHGAHPANPYELLKLVKSGLRFRRPRPGEALAVVRELGLQRLLPPPPPPQEHLPRWRRVAEGLRHSEHRDAEVIGHHYDVSNRFYELVLGPSMTYTCSLFAEPEMSLDQAQYAKYDLVARKLDLQPGQRLLDVGCGWGGMVMHAVKHYGVRALGVTLSAQQAAWGQERIAREGLGEVAEIRHLDYRHVTESGFDAVSSIGLTEHIGVANYPAYFSFLRSRLRDGGRLLNHCITRPHNRQTKTGAFIDRYIFPDGELTGVGRIITDAQDAGLEIEHAENLRMHYARTLAGWSANLERNWEECVAEVGEATAKVWGLYLAGSRIGFETNEIELHQVLAGRTPQDGTPVFPMRPQW